MSKRLIVTAATVALLGGMAGCAEDEPASPLEPPTTTTSTATDATENPGADLIGTWRADDVDWTVHFAADGTFTEDFEGNVDFRSGSYRVEGDTVTLEGDDGESNEGTLSGDTIDFRLGQLTRQ